MKTAQRTDSHPQSVMSKVLAPVFGKGYGRGLMLVGVGLTVFVAVMSILAIHRAA